MWIETEKRMLRFYPFSSKRASQAPMKPLWNEMGITGTIQVPFTVHVKFYPSHRRVIKVVPVFSLV